MLRKNILFTAIIKFVGVGCSLLIVPITLHYLKSEEYGIWLTMSSVLFWFSFFDIGLGNGMRNYLTQAISQNNFELARKYISTAFALLTAIAIIILLIVLLPILSFDMGKVFNTQNVDSVMLRNMMIIAVTFTLANFVVKNIGYIFVALQQYAINEGLFVLSNVISLIIIYILTLTTSLGNLTYVVLIFTATPVLVFLLAGIPLYIKHPELRPKYTDVDMTYGKQLVGKGLGFFLIQISSSLVIFGSSNLFITQYGKPTDVTIYNIAYKYFSLLSVAYVIIIAPLWNAYTDAYVRGDIEWIKRSFHKTQLFWLLGVACGIIMLIASPFVYRIWVGTSVSVPFPVSACVLCYICLFNFNNCVTYLLNGLNKIKVQIITSISATIIYLILVFTVGGKWGIVGISLCMSGSYLIMGSIHLYQCSLITQNRAKGIWNE